MTRGRHRLRWYTRARPAWVILLVGRRRRVTHRR
jgi:hypothetical protein